VIDLVLGLTAMGHTKGHPDLTGGGPRAKGHPDLTGVGPPMWPRRDRSELTDMAWETGTARPSIHHRTRVCY